MNNMINVTSEAMRLAFMAYRAAAEARAYADSHGSDLEREATGMASYRAEVAYGAAYVAYEAVYSVQGAGYPSPDDVEASFTF